MPYLDKQYTKEVRTELRNRFPEYKFSVRTRDHMSLSVKILSGPLNLVENEERGYESVNHFHADRHYEDFPEKQEFINKVLSVMTREYDSCVHTDGDYGNIPNFYIDLQIGNWDRPYEVKN